MLLTMKSQIEAMRAFGYVLAADVDVAHRHPDIAQRQHRQTRMDLLTPVLKGWCTELGVELASLGIQVFGGMGFVEETGAAQYLRDARIVTIYEGTTGIQSADLVGRKLTRDKGRAMATLIDEIREVETQLSDVDGDDSATIRENLTDGSEALEQATDWVLQTIGRNPDAVLAASVSYMMLNRLCLRRLADGARRTRRAGEAGAVRRRGILPRQDRNSAVLC
jgi:acyl-CoA dehydrogenase